MWERLFRVRGRGSTVRRELLGGLTTFVTMAYIVVVNPAILAAAGMPAGPATVATIVTAAFGTLLMGLLANRPIAVAPYMGENAFVAFTLTALGFTWQQALAAVFLSGLVFLAITLLGVRAWLARALSPSLKLSFAAGIGLFLVLIGLYETGVVTSGAAGLEPQALLDPATGRLGSPAVPLKLGDWRDARVLLALGGIVLTALLLQRRLRGAILAGMVLTALLGAALGHGEAPARLLAMPFRGEYRLDPVALEMDVAGVLRVEALPVLLTLLLMSFLDTLGTLLGVGAAGDMLDARGDFPDIGKPMLVDAASCVFAGLAGTTTAGAYIESATGIREGARTGLASVATAGLFLLSLFFIPAFQALQGLRYVYAPALVVVGMLMTASLARIDFDDLTELLPALATIALMVFSFNIANGLTAGLVLHPLMKALSGRHREVSMPALVLAGLSATYFFVGLPH